MYNFDVHMWSFGHRKILLAIVHACLFILHIPVKKSECNVLHLSLSCTGQLKELKNAADQGASIPLPEGNEEDDLEDDLDMEVCSYDL